MPLNHLPQADPLVADALRQELARERDSIELIASENFTSPAVMEAVGSVLTNKYAEGYPRKRYYGGCEKVDLVEDLARERACQLFGAGFANVQPHCGANANFGAYTALLELGDTVLGMSLDQGGHLTHGSPVNFSGRFYRFAAYGLDPQTETIDYDELERIAKDIRPKLVVGGASAYPRIIDFERMAAIAKEVGAYFMVDMAHIAGLVATGAHPSPVPHADVVTSTSHKTLRGPRGGFILSNDEEIAKRIDKAVFPGAQGGPLMHVIAGKAVAFGEAQQPAYKESVSYTHLDVYKRQTADCVTRHARIWSSSLLPAPTAEKTAWSVSYTHLDVYKRQVLSASICVVTCESTQVCVGISYLSRMSPSTFQIASVLSTVSVSYTHLN